MQCAGGIAAEFFCILFLSSINNPIDIIIKFMALSKIAQVDDFYASALPDGNRIKQPGPDFDIKIHKRDIEANSEKLKDFKFEKNFAFLFTRFIYKTIRITYCSVMFYFLPYFAIILPYFAMAKPEIEENYEHMHAVE